MILEPQGSRSGDSGRFLLSPSPVSFALGVLSAMNREFDAES